MSSGLLIDTLSGLGMLVLVLALGLIFVGCGGGSEEPDTWTPVASIDQLNGTWKGSYYETMLLKEYGWFKTNWGAEQEELFGNMNISVGFDEIFNINAGAGTMTQTVFSKQIFSGGKISTGWNYIRSWDWGDGTVNDKDHAISWTYNSEPGSLASFNWYIKNIQINQNGKKIKFDTFIGDKPLPDYTLTKQ
jgi:hypothetical protein